MSSITFNARNHSAVLRGSERYHMSSIVSGVAAAVAKEITAEIFLKVGNPGHYLHRAAAAAVAAKNAYAERRTYEEQRDTSLKVGGMMGEELFPGHDQFTTELNTAIMLGSAQVALFARLHGQSEIHLWIEDGDGPAIADVVERGVQKGLCRDEQGWDKVLELLRTPDVGIIVTSYSVTDSFPNNDIAVDDRLPEKPDYTNYPKMGADEKERVDGLAGDMEEIWYETFTDDDRWNAAVRGLREKDQGLRLDPAHLGATPMFFGEGTTYLDIIAAGHAA
jgi:hypothetical protein